MDLGAHFSLLRRRTVLADSREGVPRVIRVLDRIFAPGEREAAAFEFPALGGGELGHVRSSDRRFSVAAL